MSSFLHIYRMFSLVKEDYYETNFSLISDLGLSYLRQGCDVFTRRLSVCLTVCLSVSNFT